MNRDTPLSNKPKKDPFYFHKVALRPLLTTLTDEETTALFKTLDSFNLEDFFAFLRLNHLDHLWRDYLRPLDLPEPFKPWLAMLREEAFQLAAQQLVERQHLRAIHQFF